MLVLKFIWCLRSSVTNGGLRQLFIKSSSFFIRHCTLQGGYLYYNFYLMQDRDRKLRIFAGDEHPFGDRPLEPYIMPPRNVREMRPQVRRAMIRAQKMAEQQQNNKNEGKESRKKEEKVEVTA